MQLVVLANELQWEELATELPGVEWIKAAHPFRFDLYNNAAAFFILQEQPGIAFSQTGKPVFLNTVTSTLKKNGSGSNVAGINGWHTFLQRPLWEVTGELSEDAAAILKRINKTAVSVPDEPGFIAARTVAMIINEAYFAFGDGVSTKEEIDTAMKLGTNYPYGPFVWAEKIGLQQVLTLLEKLFETDQRYRPAPALIKEVQ